MTIRETHTYIATSVPVTHVFVTPAPSVVLAFVMNGGLTCH